jgi:TrmH family RNA methyltransferase
MTADVSVAVVGAGTPGNVGTVARAMKNFGFRELLLVDPPPLDPEGEAYGFAGRARQDVLPNARELTFDELVGGYHTVAFTSTTTEGADRPVRYPYATPAELAEELDGRDDVALVFGRERTGLLNDELERMDRIVTIPADPSYPVLNLGQAATIALYELRGLALDDADQLPDRSRDLAGPERIEGTIAQFEALLDAVDHAEEKRHKATLVLRRLLGRADPTWKEISVLRGVFRKAAGRIEGEWVPEDGDE